MIGFGETANGGPQESNIGDGVEHLEPRIRWMLSLRTPPRHAWMPLAIVR